MLVQRRTVGAQEFKQQRLLARLQRAPAGHARRAAGPGPITQNPDLTLTLTDESPFALAQSALRGEKPGVRIAGPALIFEAETTTVVAPGFNATVNAVGYLVLERVRTEAA